MTAAPKVRPTRHRKARPLATVFQFPALRSRETELSSTITGSHALVSAHMAFISQVKIDGVWRTMVDAATLKPYTFSTQKEAEAFRLADMWDTWRFLNRGREPKVRGIETQDCQT